MPTIRPLTVILIAGLLTACGSGSSGTSPGSSIAANRAAAASLPSSANAQQVAEHMRGSVDCPAHIPVAPAGTPVDDIVGVRPGITYEQAANAVMCSDQLLVVTPSTDRGFQIKTYGQTIRQGFSARLAQARVPVSGRDFVKEMEQENDARMMGAIRQDLEPGEQKWFVTTMGMPGKETVIGAAREVWFAKDKNPTVDSVTAELVKKYGTPTEQTDNCGYTIAAYTTAPCRSLRWAYDPRGRLITESSPLYGPCRTASNPDQGTDLSANCGIAVAAEIDRLNDNHALARSMQVGVVDQASGYALLGATEQGLQALDAARRAKEVNEAAKNAPAVSM